MSTVQAKIIDVSDTQRQFYEVSEFVNVKPGWNPVEIRRYKTVWDDDGQTGLESLDTAKLLNNVASAFKGRLEQTDKPLIAVFSSQEGAQEFARITTEFYRNTVQIDGQRVLINI